MIGKKLILAGAAAAVVAALPLAFGIIDEMEYQKKRREGAKERKEKILEALAKQKEEAEQEPMG